MPRDLTARDLALMPQTLRRTVPIAHWHHPDGSSVEVTLRGRTFGERAACYRAGVKAGAKYGTDFDADTHTVEAIWYALETPRLTAAEKPIIWDWHPEVVRRMLLVIEALETLTGAQFDDAFLELEAERQAGLAPGAAAAPEPPGRRGSGNAELAPADRAVDEPALEPAGAAV